MKRGLNNYHLTSAGVSGPTSRDPSLNTHCSLLTKAFHYLSCLLTQTLIRSLFPVLELLITLIQQPKAFVSSHQL